MYFLVVLDDTLFARKCIRGNVSYFECKQVSNGAEAKQVSITKRQNTLAAPTITFFTHNVIFLRTTEKQLMHLDLERVIFRVNLFSDALASLELRMYFSPLGVIKKVIQVAVVRTFFFS